MTWPLGSWKWSTAREALRCIKAKRWSRHRDRHRDRDDEGSQARGRDIEAFHGRQHRDRRGDRPIAKQQCGAEQPDHDQAEPNSAGRHLAAAGDHRGERQDPTLLAVAGPQHEHQVLDRYDGQEGPEDQGRAPREPNRGSPPGHRPPRRPPGTHRAGWSRCPRRPRRGHRVTSPADTADRPARYQPSLLPAACEGTPRGFAGPLVQFNACSSR